MHRSNVPLRSWHRALHIMTLHSNGMSALRLQHRPGLGSYKSAWMPVQKIRRAMDVADGFPLIMNVQVDETSIPYRLKGSEPPPGGRSHEGRLMIAGAVEVFGGNSPGCAELRRIMDQSGPTLKAFLEDAAEPGTWIVTDGWAGCDGLENRTAIAVGDTPAHEVLEWIHVLEPQALGPRRPARIPMQALGLAAHRKLVRAARSGANPPRTAALRLNSHFAARAQPDRRTFRILAESPFSARINMLWLRIQSNKPFFIFLM